MPKRYFEESINFKPGKLSDNLRHALSLRDDELPIWIYHMRVLGYPPAYLKTAEHTNTLSVFDGESSANRTFNSLGGDITEDGEVRDSEVQYNAKYFVEFPGFNCPPPPGVRDNWHRLRMPPMMKRQQLEEALKSINLKRDDPVPYKRRKIISKETNADDNNDNDSSNPSGDSSNINDLTVDSLNETDINERNDNETEVNANDDSAVNTDATVSSIVSNSVVSNASSEVFETSVNEQTSESKSNRMSFISMGSPMPVSSNPKKPPLENWAKDMGPLIYFENLPEYTGTYDKMKGIIGKIRQKLNST